MAEVGLAAAVLGIASAGLTVAKGFIQIADTIGSAGEQVRIVAAELDAFSAMLLQLKEILKTPTVASRDAQKTAEDTIEVCERILNPFKALISRLEPLLQKFRASKRQRQQLVLRVQFYFRRRSKVNFYRQAVAHVTPTLACLIATMNLQESRANTPQNVL